MPLPELSPALKWRMVGPYRGGRAMAVAGHPTDPEVFYFGSTGGGVWRTDNAGATWRNVSDRYFKRGSVGALALSTADPNVLYAGMGECGLRTDQTHGDGVYKSVDGGASWTWLGLAETQNIAKIQIHPHNPDLVYLAALGHRFGPNPERGVYRSADGGRTWARVLFVSEQAGAIDLALDPTNPRVLFAATWETQLYPWGRVQRGPGSRIYRSVDGGDTWTDLTGRPGLPGGPHARIGLCVSPAQAGRVWAQIDAGDGRGGMYRSDDGGETWAWLNDDQNFIVRSWYFMHLTADPRDADTVYVVNRKLWKSVDGGRSYRQVNTPYVDQHALWVDPNDTRRMILSNDGGVAVSVNGGQTWTSLVNQPTAEIYRAAADNHFPYRIYGSQQDNSTLCMPSRSGLGPISQMDWYDVGGGESGYITPRPDDPDIVYSSDLPGIGITRYDHRTKQIREISPWYEGDGIAADRPTYRFNWSVPIVLSPHDPDVLYILGNYVFRSTDEGAHWETVSPDLTRNDPARLRGESGTGESSVANDYCTISAFAESPRERGVLWAGSDDGLVHLSRDNGRTWTDVTPPGLPAWSLTHVEASNHVAGGAYVSASAHALDDFRPYIFRTRDYGATWESITAGIPADEFVRVIREDPVRAGLLYIGTEAGVHVSIDDGGAWQPLQFNLPHTPIHDLIVKEDDLVIATHGRSMWILDDVTPLRQWTEALATEPACLFQPDPVYRLTRQVLGLDSLLALYGTFAAENPPSGVAVTYYVGAALAGEPVTLSLLDSAGVVMQEFTSHVHEADPAPIGPYASRLRYGVAVLTGKLPSEDEPGTKWGAITLESGGGDGAAAAGPGLHRFVLPIQYPDALPLLRGSAGGVTAPVAPPGLYRVRLTVGERSWSQNVEIRKDPRVAAAPEDFAAQHVLMLKIRDKVSAVHLAVNQIHLLQGQLAACLTLAPVNRYPEIHADAAILGAKLSEIEGELVQPKLHEHSGELASVHYPPQLNAKLAALGYAVARSDSAPTQSALDVFTDLSNRADLRLDRLKAVVQVDVAAFNALLGGAGLPVLRAE